MKYLILVLSLAACGDNIKPPPDKVLDDVVIIDEDIDGTLPDAGVTPDAGTETPPPDAPEVKKSACCIGALHGNVPHECGPPPGTCKFDSICEGTALYLCTP